MSCDQARADNIFSRALRDSGVWNFRLQNPLLLRASLLLNVKLTNPFTIHLWSFRAPLIRSFGALASELRTTFTFFSLNARIDELPESRQYPLTSVPPSRVDTRVSSCHFGTLDTFFGGGGSPSSDSIPSKHWTSELSDSSQQPPPRGTTWLNTRSGHMAQYKG
jgi:hypothetical protein